jgi:hypothetical protein
MTGVLSRLGSSLRGVTSRLRAIPVAAVAMLLASSCDDSSDSEMSRSTPVYVAVVDAALDQVATPPGDELPVVYVVPVGETAIDASVQADVADAFHERADVRFADERSEAIVEDEEELPVRDEGVLVAIGDIAESGEPIEVEVEVYRSVDDSSRWVLTLARRSSQWTVTASSTVVVDASP